MPAHPRIAIGDAATDAVVGFDSCWRASVSSAVADVQTEPLEVSHQRTQHPKAKDAEVQSEEVGTDPAPAAGVSEKLHELGAFLESCTPLLEEQLHRNLTSRAFDGHEVVWDEQCDTVSCMLSLKHTGALASASPEACTAVSWNCSGTVLAAAYGKLDKNDWERCGSMLCTWSVFRRALDPERADAAIELPDCLTCLAFHPADPALLAGGAFNGDVMVWRLGTSGDPLLGKSVLNTYTHHEPVQKVVWTADPLRGQALQSHALASVSADGRLLVWSTANKLAWPTLGFVLAKPAGGGAADGGAGASLLTEGGSALGFSKDDPTSFVVGLEAGQGYKGSLHANEVRTAASILREHAEVPWTPAAAMLLTRVGGAAYRRLKTRVEKEAVLARAKEVLPAHVFAAQPEPATLFTSPLSFAYHAHSGPVYEALYSPHHRNIFLTCSTDGSVRLHNQLQAAPFHVTDPAACAIMSAAWSPSRPLVFAAAGADGVLYVYDLLKSKGKPEVTLTVTTDKSACTAVVFNSKNPSLLATADAQGHVKVWKLSSFLSEPAPREQAALERMAVPRGADGEGEAEDAHGDDRYEEEG